MSDFGTLGNAHSRSLILHRPLSASQHVTVNLLLMESYFFTIFVLPFHLSDIFRGLRLLCCQPNTRPPFVFYSTSILSLHDVAVSFLQLFFRQLSFHLPSLNVCIGRFSWVLTELTLPVYNYNSSYYLFRVS